MEHFIKLLLKEDINESNKLDFIGITEQGEYHVYKWVVVARVLVKYKLDDQGKLVKISEELARPTKDYKRLYEKILTN